MSLTHDIIKAKLVREGYLPNYPYHLISDSEMCDGFIRYEKDENEEDVLVGYFADNYPCLDTETHIDSATNKVSKSDIQVKYTQLIDSIFYHIGLLKSSLDAEYALPDWIYSYMLGSCISINNDTLDKHDLLVMLHCDNIDDVFTISASLKCLDVSENWLTKEDQSYICPVCKSIVKSYDIHCSRCSTIFDENNRIILLRPPTMFGEPHVIKSLRLAEIQST